MTILTDEYFFALQSDCRAEPMIIDCVIS